jgi:hypothetical protein
MSRLLSRRRVVGLGGAAAALAPLVGGRAAAAPLSGTLVTLQTPLRVFDSRLASSVLGGAKLAAGQSVAVTVSTAFSDGYALSVFVNVTITQTEGSGFLVIRGEDLSGLQPLPQTSNVNWWTGGLTLANLTLSPVGGEHAINVRCEGNGRTHVIVDVQGYVPFGG